MAEKDNWLELKEEGGIIKLLKGIEECPRHHFIQVENSKESPCPFCEHEKKMEMGEKKRRPGDISAKVREAFGDLFADDVFNHETPNIGEKMNTGCPDAKSGKQECEKFKGCAECWSNFFISEILPIDCV